MSYNDTLPNGQPIIADLTECEGTLDYEPITIVPSVEYLEIKRLNGESTWIALSEVICVRIDENAYIPKQQLYWLDGVGEKKDLGKLEFQAYDMTGLPKDFVEMFAVRNLPVHLGGPSEKGKEVVNGDAAGKGRGVEVHVVISTMSGTQQAKNLFEKAVKPLLAELGVKNYQVHTTESQQSIEQLTNETIVSKANEGVNLTIMLLSGDGGPVDLINSMLAGTLKEHAKMPTIALLPMGTGNALAHSSGLTKDDTFGLRAMCRGSVKPLPLFRVEMSKGAQFVVNEGKDRRKVQGEIFGAVVFSWGLHASLVAASDTTEYRKHGVERFKMAAEELLSPKDGSKAHRYQGKVSVLRTGMGKIKDFEPMERKEHMYVLATMVSNLEENLSISPESKPLDGQMRLVSWGVLEAAEIMKIFGLAYQGGKHVLDGNVGYEAIEGLRIDFQEEDEKWRQICIDGKIIAVEKGGWLEVRRESRDVVNLVVI